MLAVTVLRVPREDGLIAAIVRLQMDGAAPEFADVFEDALRVRQVEVAPFPCVAQV